LTCPINIDINVNVKIGNNEHAEEGVVR
jgi:hypothetical protein